MTLDLDDLQLSPHSFMMVSSMPLNLAFILKDFSMVDALYFHTKPRDAMRFLKQVNVRGLSWRIYGVGHFRRIITQILPSLAATDRLSRDTHPWGNQGLWYAGRHWSDE